MGSSELAIEIGSSQQQALFSNLVVSRRGGERESRMFDRLGDSFGVELLNAAEYEHFGSVDMIGHQRGIRRPAGQRNFATGWIDHVAVDPIALKNASDVSNIVHQARDDQVCVVIGG